MPIFQIIETRPSTLVSTEVLNEGIRSKLMLVLFVLFSINAKQRRSPGNKIASGLNWTKESWDNASAHINSALIDFSFVLTSEVSVLLCNNYVKFYFFLTTFYIRKTKYDYRIVSQATKRSVSPLSNIPITSMFDAPQISLG